MFFLSPGGFGGLLGAAALAALVGGLAGVERKGALQLMLSRPLVLGPALGLLLGDARGGLFLGLPLELLFLGGVNLGGSLPDHETLLTAALVGAVVTAGRATGFGVDPALAALGLALLFPLARAGRHLERAAEQRNAALLDSALQRAREGDPRVARLNFAGLLLPFTATAAVCFLATLLAPLLAAARVGLPPRFALGLEGGWHAVWALSAASAIRSIRDPRAPALAFLSFAATIAFAVALRAFA